MAEILASVWSFFLNVLKFGGLFALTCFLFLAVFLIAGLINKRLLPNRPVIRILIGFILMGTITYILHIWWFIPYL